MAFTCPETDRNGMAQNGAYHFSGHRRQLQADHGLVDEPFAEDLALTRPLEAFLHHQARESVATSNHPPAFLCECGDFQNAHIAQ